MEQETPKPLERILQPRGKMQEAENTDLWAYPAEARVITTNGVVKKNGCCVMGAGCAKEARIRFPGIDFRLGRLIQTEGNHVHIIQDNPLIISFPVKHRFYEKADLALIKESACQLVLLVDRFGFKTVVLPRPGCGNGGRWWFAEVRPILIDILDDRFTVVHKGGPTVQETKALYRVD